jgi:D-3-phosphoglycerate dehydrogenase / 2-oxoglutarate reductase
MKISILDDYHDTLRTLDCFTKLSGLDVEVFTDHVEDVDVLAERLRDTEAIVLIRERTEIRSPLLRRLPKLRLISQRSV